MTNNNGGGMDVFNSTSYNGGMIDLSMPDESLDNMA